MDPINMFAALAAVMGGTCGFVCAWRERVWKERIMVLRHRARIAHVESSSIMMTAAVDALMEKDSRLDKADAVKMIIAKANAMGASIQMINAHSPEQLDRKMAEELANYDGPL